MTGPAPAIGATAARPDPVPRLAAGTASGTAFADALRRAGASAAAGAVPGSPTPDSALPGPVPAGTGAAGRTVLDTALLGLGRRSPATDSAASVAEVYRRLGVVLPPTAEEQATMGVAVAGLASARSGDLVVLGDSSPQVGIYAGRGRVVLAPADGGPVRMQDIDSTVTAIRRIVSEAGGPTPAASVGSATVGAGTGAAAATGFGPGPAAASPLAAPGQAPSGTGWAGVPHRQLFEQAGAAHGIDPAVLAAVAQVESGFDTRAVSRAGAQGLMQFMPRTAAGLGVDPLDPASAIPGAARYLRSGLDRFGSLELALAAYNAGPGAVQRHGGVPPFRETQNYVRKVLEAREQYRR